MKLPRSIAAAALLAAAAVLIPMGSAGAQDLSARVVSSGQSGVLAVPVNTSRVVEVSSPVTRVSVGNPDIADILILGGNQIYVLGQALGSTNVRLWNANNVLVSTFAVQVTHNLEALKRMLDDILPGESIEVYSAQRDIVLAGQVSSPTRLASALRLAESHASEVNGRSEVINLLSVGGVQQVMLEVTVAELRRTEMRQLQPQLHTLTESGNWVMGAVQGGATFPGFGQLMPGTQSIETSGIFASLLGGSSVVDLVLGVAKERGVATVLAEPTLTTLSGQEAEFLSGGRFPIPVPQPNGVTSIEFQDFGVALGFLPVILDDNRINLKLNVSVSEPGAETFIPTGPDTLFRVPERLSERRASSTVELADGQTIGIAGLISEELRASVNKFPGLGDIPILGQLFRSQQYLRGETELVILVTPRLARPIRPADIRLPTDAFVDPTQAEFYILGRIEGRRRNGDEADAGSGAGGTTGSVTSGGPSGAFGHSSN